LHYWRREVDTKVAFGLDEIEWILANVPEAGQMTLEEAYKLALQRDEDAAWQLHQDWLAAGGEK